jgi:hypothetical protein
MPLTIYIYRDEKPRSSHWVRYTAIFAFLMVMASVICNIRSFTNLRIELKS